MLIPYIEIIHGHFDLETNDYNEGIKTIENAIEHDIKENNIKKVKTDKFIGIYDKDKYFKPQDQRFRYTYTTRRRQNEEDE